jgi:hypothetical protein
MSIPNDNHPYDFHGSLATIDHDVPMYFADFLAMHAEIRDANAHTRLQNDLIEHLWRLKWNSEGTS